MGDFDSVFGEISKFFIADKPIDLDGVTCVSPADWNPLERRPEDKDWNELDINVEVPQFSPFDAVFPLEQEESDSAFDWTSFMSGEPITLNFTIDAKSVQGLRKLVRCPKLPRKLKKHVKKTCFDEYPKRASAPVLRFAFAVNNPAKAGKVGLYIGVDLAKEDEQERH